MTTGLSTVSLKNNKRKTRKMQDVNVSHPITEGHAMKSLRRVIKPLARKGKKGEN
jgi:hypothetical protein